MRTGTNKQAHVQTHRHNTGFFDDKLIACDLCHVTSLSTSYGNRILFPNPDPLPLESASYPQGTLALLLNTVSRV